MKDLQPIDIAAAEEAELAWQWALKHLKQKDPRIAYEYGVRAGFGIGAKFERERVMAILNNLKTNDAAAATWFLSHITKTLEEADGL